MRKDKVKVIGENASDEKIKSYLTLEPTSDTQADLYKLIKAYRGLKSDDFIKFVKLFVAGGFNLEATNNNGQTFKQIISKHKNSLPYLEALK